MNINKIIYVSIKVAWILIMRWGKFIDPAAMFVYMWHHLVGGGVPKWLAYYYKLLLFVRRKPVSLRLVPYITTGGNVVIFSFEIVEPFP